MPTNKRQYNVVLDDDTDKALWALIATERMTATKLIRHLIATHPDIIAISQVIGLMPNPDSTQHGGKRDKPVAPKSSNHRASSLVYAPAMTSDDDTRYEPINE